VLLKLWGKHDIKLQAKDLMIAISSYNNKVIIINDHKLKSRN